MATSKPRKLPVADLGLSFGAVAFPIHVWAIVNLLNVLPAWLLRQSLGEVAGAVAYPLAFALLESAVLWLLLVGVGALIPRRWLGERFLSLSSALAWVLSAWAIAIQFFADSILRWGMELLLPAWLLLVSSLVGAAWLALRSARLDGWIRRLAQNLAVVAYVYLVFDVIAIFVILFRNLRG